VADTARSCDDGLRDAGGLTEARGAGTSLRMQQPSSGNVLVGSALAIATTSPHTLQTCELKSAFEPT